MRHERKNRRTQRGASLVYLAVSATVLFGALGMAFDLGRRFIIQTELQSYTDAAALAAVYQLDGTQRGIQTANTVATAGPFGTRNPAGYYFDSKPVTGVTTSYSTSLNGTYDSYATAVIATTNHYAFVKVSATATAPVTFLRIVQGIPSSMTANASATAGQMAKTSISQGGSGPFIPDAHDASDTVNFGLIPGGEYTLKWGNGGGGGNGNGKGKGNSGGSADTTCANDLSWTNPNPTAQHGFVDIGEGNSNSNVRTAIVYGGYPNANSTPSSISVGMSLSGVPGNRGTSIFDSLQERVNQDTDATSTTYADYVSGGRGNGRRILTVPIGDPSTWSGNGNGTETVIGFANFFLETHYSGTSDPICAIYIGPASLNGAGAGRTDSTKVYMNVLYK